MGLKKMNILILGGDGYLGWPAAFFFKNHFKVTIIDNFSKKKIEFENSISTRSSNSHKRKIRDLE